MASVRPSMTATQINKYLKNYREITFKAGTYNLKKPLVLYSNTKIICEPNVILKRDHSGRMMQVNVSPSTTKYNGAHDISWTGGKFVANTNSNAAIVIVVVHSKNITFDNVTVDGCVGLHSFEINSSKNVKITNCTIMNQTSREGENHKEAIQIDFCFKGGLGLEGATEKSPCYDDTHCQNITISDCKFINCPNGIGTHTVSYEEEYHTNIDIRNCTFTNIEKNAIRLLGMSKVTITDCVGKIVIDKAKKAHRSVGGKVTLDNYRYNNDVTINNITVA